MNAIGDGGLMRFDEVVVEEVDEIERECLEWKI